MCFSESNHYSSSVLRQHKFLTTLMERLNKPEECDKVIAELESVRQIVTDPSYMVVHLAANLDLLATKYANPAELWNQLLPRGKASIKNK